MSSPLAMILVVFIIVLGIGACWAITGQGASTGPVQDSFGNTQISNQSNESAALAVATMPVMYMAFIIAICVVLVIAFAWMWKTGKTKPSKY